jgi:LytS/YehU family sensor histidine kinase
VLLTAVAGLVLVRSDRRDFLDPSFFVIFGVLMLVVFASLGLQLQAARRRSQEAVLNAARLQTELLKKNIQPHFLMNTLTTVMEVVEQDPKTAVQLIDALAGEFRILARVAGEKLIPLGQELELCRAHLEIMSLRRGVAATLEVYDADQTSPVPPALFHTLIEGGLTHQIPRDGRLRFTLDAAYQPGWARYALVVHGGNPPATVPPLDGTGYRYVKARLEESYPGRWTFHAGPVEAGWQSVIEIRFPPGESGSP